MGNSLRLHACRLFSCLASLLFAEATWAHKNEFEPQELGKGDWLIRGSVISIRSLTQSSDIPLVGGRIKSQDIHTIGLDISYFITNHWALEFQGGQLDREYKVARSSVGDFSVGKIDSYAMTLALQYHFKPSRLIMPYIGLGLNYAWAKSVDPAENIPDFDVKPMTSAMAALGIDIPISAHWVANASARYFLSPTYNFDGNGFQADVQINTLVLGAGVGFFF